MTKQNKKTLYVVGGLVLLIIIVMVIVRKRKRNQEESFDAPTTGGSGSSTTSGGSTSSASTCTNKTVLKKGTKCDRVEWSQYYINKVADDLHITPLVQDGVFGSKTEAAFVAVLGKKTGSYKEIKGAIDLMQPQINIIQ